MAFSTITRLYDDHQEARAVVQALETAGIAHDQISLIGRDGQAEPGTVVDRDATPRAQVAGTAVDPRAGITTEATTNRADDLQAERAERSAAGGAVLGTALGGGLGLLAGIGTLAIPGVGPVVAAGWLIATITGAGAGAALAAGAGGLVGALTNAGVHENDAHLFAESVRRGSSLVSVRVADDVQAREVNAILDRHTAVDLPARRTAYEGEGWQRHDETGAV